MQNQKAQRGRRFPFHKFFTDSRSIGLTLLLCTGLSLIMTNLGSMGVIYHDFWLKEIPFFHQLKLPHSLLHFVNDALMAVFFFQVGIEIKRETIVGELSSLNKALFPAIAALCGVAFPAIIFSIITRGSGFENGWAIPTATDIAFSLGILAMVGKSVPFSLKIFLTALAIIDDLLAIIIIAFFYGKAPHGLWLGGVALCILAVLYVVKKHAHTKIGSILFVVLGILMWYCMFNSGLHATFAGIIMAAMLPVKKINRYESVLHLPVGFLIIPIFALANTSLYISGSSFTNLTSPLSLGIILGLFLGKPLGIISATYYLTKRKIINLPKDITLRQFLGVGFLAGIGFTMSIFISTLAFDDKINSDTAKIAVLIASILSMTIGFIWLKISFPQIPQREHVVKTSEYN
ncbi:MAG: Na+/H+ antiporter NhaA [Dysgonamonadaceae bacterium]|jgi:NhaA family Na+:H+ antiporter|nr:Na+/H+ antiporter NhaA [Dysgonamonadaceae bacterium]MDD3355876.1 Na+/H+ antiporter NhaA [Dysgonamonadaceae bacterium]MDD3726869.1 Na+/H+ antiporter NhaA [Dysgonamonadaceae bacterium]MDD4246940.1 Na+/H+ antiporter NhaA [Dysgonamonadaceae bacterium]MDD4606315.1 Na+/H+ antiporter NhaA [Dysgonamonadaceae bacterium]